MEDRLRIALVLNRYDPSLGGLEAWTEGLVGWLIGRGHEVTVIATSRAEGAAPYRFVAVEPSTSPMKLAAAIAERIGQFDFDIVHDTGTGYRADVMQPLTGSRLVNSGCDVAALPPMRQLRARLSPQLTRWRREMEVLERRQFSDPSRMIAVSRMVRDQIGARYEVDRSQIAVIHNGVDTDRFSPARLAALRGAARQQWALQGAPVFLLVANNFHLKGVATAIGALARLRREMPDAQLAVAGSGDAAAYRRLAEARGVGRSVIFLGYVGKIEEACAAADVAIQPTHYDTCSLATLEGLASALPTITTAANGAAELIIDGQEGFRLPRAGDEAALAAAMLKLGNPVLRQTMGAAAHRAALAHDVSVNYSRIEAFYRRMLAQAAWKRRPAA
jgi:UDP-glucose:(heptosyl)LPS alpha-1,3-glucosyltransferase